MKWTSEQDRVLHDTVASSTSKQEVMARLERALGFPISFESADKRMRRAFGKSVHASLSIPVDWEDPEGSRTEPASSSDHPRVTIPGPPPVPREHRFTSHHYPLPKLSHAGDYQRVLIIPDTHVPYHDQEAWALMLRAARVFQPDGIVHLGDLADFYAVSFHSKDPARKECLRDECGEVKRALDPVDALPSVKWKKITKGNHEFRLERFIAEKAPELHGLVETDKLLEFRERGWDVIPYGQSVKIGHMHFTHDEGTSGPLAHIKAGATFEGSVVIGHTHAMGCQYWRNADGDEHVSASFGWMGDFETIEYMHRAKARRWQLGFGIGLLQPDGVMRLQACPIIKRGVDILGTLVT